MREKLFHGKRKDNGDWVEGYYIKYQGMSFILPEHSQHFYLFDNAPEVIPETVGEYIGKTDKNDKKIFEGDIANAEILYDVGCYPHTENKKFIVKIPDIYRISYRSFEVIGNIHDNSELLTGDSNV